MALRFLIVAVALLAAGCYEPPETVVLGENTRLLDGRPIRPVHEDNEIFAPWTHGRSAVWAAVYEHLRAAGIEDPAARMEAALVRHLTERTGAAGLGPPLVFGAKKPEDLAAWARAQGVSDPVIDVDTKVWGLEWWSGSVVYRAMFRLIDPASGRTLAQHLCEMRSPALAMAPKTSQNPFPQDDASLALLADNAAPVKAIIDDLVEACVEAMAAAL